MANNKNSKKNEQKNGDSVTDDSTQEDEQNAAEGLSEKDRNIISRDIENAKKNKHQNGDSVAEDKTQENEKDDVALEETEASTESSTSLAFSSPESTSPKSSVVQPTLSKPAAVPKPPSSTRSPKSRATSKIQTSPKARAATKMSPPSELKTASEKPCSPKIGTLTETPSLPKLDSASKSSPQTKLNSASKSNSHSKLNTVSRSPSFSKLEIVSKSSSNSNLEAASKTPSSPKLKEIEPTAEEKEEQEIRRRARREAIDEYLADEFAPTIFEKINAPIRPVTNFECFRKKKKRTDSPGSLSSPTPHPSSPVKAPILSVYMVPELARAPPAESLAESGSEKSESIHMFTNTARPQMIPQIPKESDETNIDPHVPYKSSKARKKERKHLRRFMKKFFGPSKQSYHHQLGKEGTADAAMEKDGAVQSSDEPKDRISIDAEAAMARSTYFAPDMRDGQMTSVTDTDAGYFDVGSATNTAVSTTLKVPSETESSKQPVSYISTMSETSTSSHLAAVAADLQKFTSAAPLSSVKSAAVTNTQPPKQHRRRMRREVKTHEARLQRPHRKPKEKDASVPGTGIPQDPPKGAPMKRKPKDLRHEKKQAGSDDKCPLYKGGKIYTTKTGQQYVYVKCTRKNHKGEVVVQYVPRLLK